MRYILLIFCASSFLACNNNHPYIATITAQPFPLNKGNQWVYEANIKYHQKETDALVEERMEWVMEVVDTIHHGNYFAAVIKGFPTDLVWYDGKANRGDYVLLQDSNKIYLCSFDPFDSLLARLRNPKDSLLDLIDSQDILFDFPLIKNKTWGADPEMPQRKDSMYAWVVKKADTNTSEAEVQYMTNPDHSIFQFQSNIGIKGYYFEHHGTVMELKMHLIRKTLH